MNYLKYDVVTIGNHEFDYKVEQLYNLSHILETGYICANFLWRKNQSNIFPPYKIIEFEDINIKIGFIGVVTPQALTNSYLHNLVDEDGEFVYDFLTENKGENLYAKIQYYINDLKQQKKVNYVIILSHLGYDGDIPEEFSSRGLLANIEGIDAIIDGHTHMVYNSTHKDKDKKDIYISQAGTKLDAVGKLTIQENGNIISEIIDQIPYPDDYENVHIVNREGIERYVDNETYLFLQNILDSHEHEFNEIVGYSDFYFNIYIVLRIEENPLGDLITDAIRYFGEADISMINAGSIRTELKKGNITYNNILDILPFNARIIVKEVLGKDILDALEFGMKYLPEMSARFLQVSGVKFKVDENMTSPVIVDEGDNFVRVEGDRRVFDVYVGDEKLDENKKYKIAFDEYLGEGGDGFSMFSKYKMTKDTLLTDNEVLKQYIITVLNRNIPEKYNSAQGRIVKQNKYSKDIIILHTNDVHCGIEDKIGYDGLMLYKKELEKKYKHVLLVDAGDHIQGGTIGLLSKGKDIIDIMNYLKYDAVTIGNHEFDYKIEQLFNLSHIIDAGYICANFLWRKNQTTVFPPYKIIELKDSNIKIGFIGVVTHQALTKSYLHNLVDEDGELIYDFLAEDDGKKLYSKIQGYIDELKNEAGVNYVIILSHLGYGGDSIEELSSKGLLANIKGVDAIIDGHTHLIYNSTFKDLEGKDIYISQTGTKLETVGKLTIKEDGTILSEIIDQIPFPDDYENVYTVNRTGIERYVDKETYQYLEDIINSHEKEFKEVIGYSDFDLLIYNDSRENRQVIRYEENILADLVTDAFRYFGDAEVTMTNAGAIRTSLFKGEITYNEILDVLPFNDRIIVKEVLGKDILDALEFGMKSLPDKTSRFTQVSGVKFKVDDSIKSPIIIDENENFVRVEGERRVYDVYIGNEKLDENKLYKMSLDEYIADGGDGFSMFSKYNMTNDTLLADNEILKQYIITVLNRNIPDKYRKPQGRIVKEKKLSNDIIILHTNDVHCGIEDLIGYDGLMLYKKELERKYKHVLLVDAGDHIQGGTIGLLSKGKDIIDIMNYLKYDVVTIGNHEFDYKVEQLYNLSQMLDAGYISANFLWRKNHSNVFPPYKIVNFKDSDITIGFIGVVTPQALTNSYLHNLVDEDGELVFDFLTENKGENLYAKIQYYINVLKQQKKVNYVIILSHLGYDGDIPEEFSSRGLLSNVEGIDAIIDGHTHMVYNSTHKDKDKKDIYISQAGTKLQAVGKLTIKENDNIISEIIDQIPYPDSPENVNIVTRNGTVRYVDSETYQFLQNIIDSHEHEFNEVVGYSEFDFNIYIVLRIEENPLGDLIADAIRYFGEADISMINAGSIRNELKKGNIKYNNILDILPFNARIIVKEVLGKDILDALEFGMKYLPDMSARFLQVSGFKFKVDEKIKNPVIVDEGDNFVRVEGDRRVFDVYIGEEKLDENKIYKIAFDEYLGEGGDGFSMFSKYKMTKDTLLADNEVLKQFIITILNRKIPNIYKTTQGRIVKQSKRSNDIIILHTNDVHCGIEDLIGYDGLMLYKKELEKKYKHVLLVDAGDHIQGGTIGLLSKGKDIIDIMNYLKYDVVTIGNHEFDYKVEQLYNLSQMLDAGYISANFLWRKNQSTVFPPYKIVNFKDSDIMIGFIGVVTPQALTNSYLHNLVDEHGELVYDFLTENKGENLYAKIQYYINVLKQQKKVKYVIILSHLGYDGDIPEEFSSRGLLANIEGIDAIIDGHTHMVYNSTHKDKDKKDIYISQAGTKLDAVGKLTIKEDGNIISEIIDKIPYPDSSDNVQTVNRNGIERYVDNETYQFLQNIIDSHEHEFNEFVGYSEFDFNIYIVVRIEENPLGDLITDAIRYFGEADISMINAGSIRKELKKGDITYNNILDILPFNARIIVKEVLGKDILDALEFGMKYLPEMSARFLQISGVKFKVDENMTSPVIVDEDDNFVGVEGERRVYDVYIGEEKLDENKIYKIAFDEYLGEGGDGFSMFSKYKMTKDTLLTDNEVLKQYIITVLNRNITENYNSTQGRIVKQKKEIPTKPDNSNNSNNYIRYLWEFSFLLLFMMF